MESPISAIGFSKIEENNGLAKIISEVIDKPTEQKASEKEDKSIIGEYLKEFGNGMYMMARVVLEKEKNGKKAEIKQCEPYVKGNHTIKVDGLSVECLEEDYDYYVICEEIETGMQFIFWLQNVVEYIDAVELMDTINEIQIVALAMEGTIILPMEEDAEEDAAEAKERERTRVLLEQAREGDEEARQKLEAEEKELDKQLKERLYEEDFLSIMNGYFVPTTLVDATYAILGNIIGIETRINTQTKEESYLLTLNVNEVPLEILINKNNLVGYPTIGMRFMGTCWLQGTVVIDK